jgi:hypothetical protein
MHFQNAASFVPISKVLFRRIEKSAEANKYDWAILRLVFILIVLLLAILYLETATYLHTGMRKGGLL